MNNALYTSENGGLIALPGHLHLSNSFQLVLFLPQQIDRDLQIRHAVRLRRGQLPVPQVHLQARDDQPRHPQLAVPLAPPLRKLLPRRVRGQLLVRRLLLPDRRLEQQFPPARLVIVPHEDAGVVRQLVVQALHRRVQVGAAPAGEVAAGRAEIGHEDGISGKDGVAQDVADARGGVPGGVNDLPLDLPELEGVVVVEQDVGLRSVRFEVRFGVVENPAEDLLDLRDVGPDASFGGRVLFFEVLGPGEVIG